MKIEQNERRQLSQRVTTRWRHEGVRWIAAGAMFAAIGCGGNPPGNTGDAHVDDAASSDVRPSSDTGTSDATGTMGDAITSDAAMDATVDAADATGATGDANGATDDAAGGPLTGIVYIQEIASDVNGTHMEGTLESAGFGPGSLEYSTFTGCANRTVGPCEVSVCPDPAAGADAGTTLGRFDSAGLLTLGGGTGADVVMMPGTDNNYATGFQSSYRWQGGDIVTVHAAGDTVPAFDTSLTYPAPVTVTSPVSTGFTDPVTVRPADGLTLQWVADTSTSTEVFVTLEQNYRLLQPHVVVQCAFSAAAGTGSVPPEALSDLAAQSTASTDSYLSVGNIQRVNVTAGNYTVTVRAIAATPFGAEMLVE